MASRQLKVRNPLITDGGRCETTTKPGVGLGDDSSIAVDNITILSYMCLTLVRTLSTDVLQ